VKNRKEKNSVKRFIHVGVGGFGRVWVNVLRESKSAKVVALVDVREDALEAARQAGGYDRRICFKSLEEALSKVEADAIVTSTPPAFHMHDVCAAMKAGLHAITEKPMSDSMESCRAILKTAIETGRSCVVSQNYRYSPAMATVAAIVRSGKLGRIGQVKLDFYMGVDFHGGFRHEMPYPVIIDMSIHHFDLIRYVTGLDPVNVSGAAWNPPWSNYKGDCSSTALFEMNNGARVLYNASWCAKGAFCDWNGNWQIEGEKGTLLYRKGEIRLLHAPSLYAVKREEIFPARPLKLQGQTHVLHDFLRAISGNKRAPTDVRDNIHSVAMVFAAVRAMETGRRTPVLDEATKALVSRIK